MSMALPIPIFVIVQKKRVMASFFFIEKVNANWDVSILRRITCSTGNEY